MRLSEAFQKCYEEKWRFNKDPKNPLARAKYIVRLMHNPYINDISNEDITQLIEKLERKNLTTATINRYLATLRAALLLAYRKWKTLESMPYIKLSAKYGSSRSPNTAQADHPIRFIAIA